MQIGHEGHAQIPRYPGQPPFEPPTLGMNTTIPPRVMSQYFRSVNHRNGRPAHEQGYMRGYGRIANEEPARQGPVRSKGSWRSSTKTRYLGLHPGPPGGSRYSAQMNRKGGKKGKGKEGAKQPEKVKEKEDTEDEDEEEQQWEDKDDEELVPDSPCADDFSDSDFKL